MESMFTPGIGNRMSLLLFLTVYVSICGSFCFSQEHNSLQFTHYGYEEGLPINPIDVIFQDQQGYMWFGSQYGLCRFDGYSFQLYRHEFEDLASLTHSHVTSIAEDSKQNLWIGTINGVTKMESSRMNIERLDMRKLTNNENSSNKISSIYIHEDDGIWLGSENTLYRLDPSDHRIQTFSVVQHEKIVDILSISYNLQESLLLGTNDGLYSFDINSFEVVKFPYQESMRSKDLRYGDQLPSTLIYDIHTSSISSIWIGSWLGGLTHYNSVSNEFLRYPYAYHLENEIINQAVLSIAEDSMGYLWLGTIGGLYRFHPKTNTILHDIHSNIRENSLSSNRVRVVYPERSGAMWLATDMLLHRYEPSQNPFVFLIHNPVNSNSLGANPVYSMCEGLDGIIWFGTLSGGLNSYDPGDEVVRRYLNNPNDDTSLPDNTITALATDHSGKIWVGTWTKGVCLFDPQTGTTKRFPYTSERRADLDGKSISGNTVRAIYVDPSHKVWIGTENGDISVYDSNTERFHYYIDPFKEYLGFTHSSVYTIYGDHSGQIWVGTGSYGESHPGLGLYRFDDEHDCFEYMHTQRNIIRNWDERIPHMSEDRNYRLWFATQDGLSVRDLLTGEFTHYYPPDGFWGTYIYSVVPADDGTIWVSTDKFGLSRFDPESNEVQNFGLSNGLQNLRYLSGSALKAQDGTLYFGGMGGVTILPKGKLPINTNIPSLAIKSIKVLEDDILIPSLTKNSPSRFSYWQNVFQFEFVSLNYTFPTKNKYQYRLLGLQDQWSTPDTTRIASYSYLPPGEYEFQIKGSNNDDYWNEIPVSYSFFIAPPFWQTLWFRTAVAFLVVSFFIGLYVYRINRMKIINQLLEQEVENRTTLLRSNFTYLENIINTSPHIIIGFDPEEQITFINPAGLDILGSNNSTYIGHPFWAIASNSDGRRRLKEMIVQYKDQKQLENQVTLLLPSEQKRSLLWNFVDHYNENGEIVETLAFGKDITDHLEKEILKVSNREQRRIGQEIHDSLCQTLTGLHYMCESVITERDRLSETKASLLEAMHVHLKKVTDQSRSIARSLYLVEKESKHLDQALLSLAENIENLFGVKINVYCSDSIFCENASESIHIYRIVQEALSNAVKYSQSHTIELTLQQRDSHLDIIIKDHGIGFDREEKNQKGMGIGLMLYRAKILGADLQIQSGLSNGTTVFLSVPHSKEATV